MIETSDTPPGANPLLSTAQRAALASVRTIARRGQRVALARIADLLAADCPARGVDVDALVAAIRDGRRVGLNFHPDRFDASGRIVAESLLETGTYRSQFETGSSNGGLSAYPGGDRDRWEGRLFGGAYQAQGDALHDRPKYGALNLMNHPDGPSPRFGSCHFRLHRAVLERSTFCFGDSHQDPGALGTIDCFEPLLAALIEAVHIAGAALGRPETTVAGLVDLLQSPEGQAPGSGAIQGRALDDYIETQVHGPVDLGRDVEALVADPSFRDSSIESTLVDMATRYGFDLGWHGGFELAADDVPAHFRGAAIAVLGTRIARDFGDGSQQLHAQIIGRAARSVVTEPERWKNWGTPVETLQHIKQLWHVLVRFGHPATSR